MDNYAILTDSCSDMEKEFRDKYGIKYVSMHFTARGKEYAADLDWQNISARDFYDIMREGDRITSAALNDGEYCKFFSEFLDAGRDILYLGCSSALSMSVKSSFIACEKLKEKYPERKIVCIDTLRAGCVLSLLIIEAAKLKAAGKSLEEVADFVEKNKLKFNQEGTVESLTYLKRAGRVSAASAFFGGILSVKPIIIADATGQNAAIEKVLGKAKAFARLAERVTERAEITDDRNTILISHSDCVEDAEKIRDMIDERLKAKNITADFHIGYVDSAIGGSVGPGTIMIAYFGERVTYNG